MLYANRDKTRLVVEDDPEAAYAVNPDHPGEFLGLVKAQRDAEEAARAEKERKAEEKASASEAKPAPKEEDPAPRRR